MGGIETGEAQTSPRQTLHILRVALRERRITGVLVDNHDARLDGGECATDLDHLVASVECGDRVDRLTSGGRKTD